MQALSRTRRPTAADLTRRRLIAAAATFGIGGGSLLAGAWPISAGAQTPVPTGAILDVGPGQAYRTPGEAAVAARNGDLIRIAPGNYVDCARWRASDLRIVAPAGDVTVRDRICDRKGIWVIAGNNVLIEGITFSGAALPNRIGTGIRAEGTTLTVRRCRFVGNQLGLLASPIAASTIEIESCAFLSNGPSHGVYVNEVGRLVVRDSVFRSHLIRHPIKSRAFETEVTGNVIEDGDSGSSSYLVEAPNGGTVVIVGNTLHKGPNTDNPGTAISIGVEGNLHSSSGILVADNLFTNDGPTKTVFVRNFTETPAHLQRNRLVGAVDPLAGPGDWRP